jgi:hypothetical protein
MGAGEIQLLATGAHDSFIMGNPDTTFFKQVFKKHTNFAMEHIRVEFDNIASSTTNTKMVGYTKIKRFADLLSDMYLVFDLPNIYSTSDENFKWTDNLGQNIIDYVEILIDGELLDKQYGQWMNINSSTNYNDSRTVYHKMIGHNLPTNYNGVYSTTATPSINKRRLYIPFNFWFCKSPGVAIPLIALQSSEIQVKVHFNELNKLFTIGSLNKSPKKFYEDDTTGLTANELILRNNYTENTLFWKFVSGSTSNINIWTQHTHLECNYIYLEEAERRYFALQEHEYLIQQIQRREFTGLDVTAHLLEIDVTHPTSEIQWVFQRNDVDLYNQWNNYTNTLDNTLVYDSNTINKADIDAFDDGKNIMYNFKLIFNGRERFQTKDHHFFNLLQHYKYHTAIDIPDGIYTYSFANNPEKEQPTGSANFAGINKIEIQTLIKEKPLADTFNYNMYLYTKSYNIFRILGGMGRLVYAL